MPDLLADLAPMRTVLPFTTSAGDTVSISKGVIYLNARPQSRGAALDLSIALARAVNDTDHTDHTNPTEASHG